MAAGRRHHEIGSGGLEFTMVGTVRRARRRGVRNGIFRRCSSDVQEGMSNFAMQRMILLTGGITLVILMSDFFEQT